MAHRFGALITAVTLGSLALCCLFSNVGLKRIGALIFFILSIQVSLGILNIHWLLPLPIAVAHNGVAAMLLLGVITLNIKLYENNYV